MCFNARFVTGDSRKDFGPRQATMGNIGPTERKHTEQVERQAVVQAHIDDSEDDDI